MDESRIADPSSALRRSDRSLPTRLSRAVSVVLHPLVMPLYVILLLVAGPTQLSYFPASVKFYLLWVTVLYTAVIPLLSVGLLRSVGRISSLAIDDRRERILPLAIGIVCYLLCAATVARIPSAMIVRKFMLAGACCELFCLAVTFYWKISLHLAAQGAAAALLVLLTFGCARLGTSVAGMPHDPPGRRRLCRRVHRRDARRAAVVGVRRKDSLPLVPPLDLLPLLARSRSSEGGR